MFKRICCVTLSLSAMPCLAEQSFDFPATTAEDPAALAQIMPKLAESVIAAYHDDDRRSYLDKLFRLQIVAGRYDDALKSLSELHALRADKAHPQAAAIDVQYDIYARAKAGQDASGFPAAFQQAFRAVMAKLDDRGSALVMRALNVEPTANGSLVVDFSAMQRDLDAALKQQKGKTSIGLDDALNLVRAYQVEEAYRSFMPLLAPLVAEDDARRYFIDRDLQVKTPDGAITCVLAVRPRTGLKRLTTLFEFTIYADTSTNMSEARRNASNGYAGVEGLSRGKGCSPGQAVPFERDGVDADAVINWIARQPWSDGRVGMFGGSYDGFSQWAAAKHMPKALKAMMPSVTAAPGIDVPMEGNVFQTFSYYWPLYVTANRELDAKALNDNDRWNKLYRDWYLSGKSYRDMQSLDSEPNPIWQRWLDHPSYDSYWQSMIPYQEEFARIRIPVLTTTGYYDGGQIGALYYFIQHHKYMPEARHYLVIGPYDHVGGQRGTVGVLGQNHEVFWGYKIEPAAHLDLGELRYQWFDYVFKGAPKPALLQDTVNYQVMGANLWKHAPSLAAMGTRTLRFHLSAAKSGEAYRLSVPAPKDGASITQTLDLADRSDVDRNYTGDGLDTWNSLEFISDPLDKPTEFSGLFSGMLDLVTNKKDLDISIALFEVTPKGEYVQLSWYLNRASYIKDRSHRRLLTPGVRQQLSFQNGRLTSRLLQPGSRLVMLLGLLRQPSTQINYGSGKDVSDETAADGKEPLTVQWFDDSYIEIPIGK